MRYRRVLAVAAGAVCSVSSAAVTGAASVQAAPAPSRPGVAGAWGKAIEVPGLGALTTKHHPAVVNDISCFSAGNCAAYGTYGPRDLGFVAVESKGRWRKAIGLPGLGALPRLHGGLSPFSFACGSVGNCAAGGYYFGPQNGEVHAFVASENNGSWAKAMLVPGLRDLNTGNDAELTSVACSAGRYCAAGGIYMTIPNGRNAFVISERNGRRGKAMPVPGLKASEFAWLRTLSCASPGNCSAGGSLTVGQAEEGFVAVEKNGAWRKAIVVPGLETLNTGGQAEVDQMSCAAAGNCTAGGTYLHRDRLQVFMASEKNGKWGKAITLPGLKTLNAGGFSTVGSISCASPGNCAVGGTYWDSVWASQGYVAVEKNGTWRKAIEVPHLGALNKGGNVQGVGVSCGSAGYCAAGGDYLATPDDGSGFRHFGAFVAIWSNGRWGNATQPPGLSTLNAGNNSSVSAISCSSPGHCVAGGYYQDRSLDLRGFVVSQK